MTSINLSLIRVIKYLKLINFPESEFNLFFKSKATNVCPFCGNNDIISNGFRTSQKTNPRSKCKKCKKTFYSTYNIYNKKIKGIKNNIAFYLFIIECLCLEYESELISRKISDKTIINETLSKSEKDSLERSISDRRKFVTRKTLNDIVSNQNLSKRTCIRWKNILDTSIEKLVNKYGDNSVPYNDLLFSFLQEAHKGYNYHNNHDQKYSDFIRALLLLIEFIDTIE